MTSKSPREESRSKSKARLALRLGTAALAAAFSQAIPVALIAAPTFAAKDPSSPATVANAAAWPTAWTEYKFADGATIADPQSEPGISPDNVDIASDGGTQPSVFYAYDGTNAFFRLRVLGNPVDSNKGGFDNAFWLVQLATSDDVVRAVVGLNGKPVDTDYVYVSNGAGTAVTPVYQTPFDPGAGQQGARAVSDGNGQFFVDFQVPMSFIYAASGNTVTAATALHLVFGTSQAANLATINKDGLVPSTDYSSLDATPLRGRSSSSTSVSCADSSVTYGATTTCTVTVADNAASEPSQPSGTVSVTAVDGNLSAATCSLVGATSSTSTCTVTFTGWAVGAGSVNAAYAGDTAHNASGGSANVTVGAAPLTITANDKGRLVGESDPTFDVSYDGFVGTDDASALAGFLGCTTSATAASPAGDYAISCSGLTSGVYEISFVDGTLSVGKATPTITSGTPAALTYGDGLPNDPTGGDTASVPGTFSYDPEPGTVLHVGSHTIHVTFTPTDGDSYTTVEYDVTVEVTPAPLTVTAKDAQRNEGEADPSFTAKYDGFVNGDDEASLNGTLSCATDATADATAGNYGISCSGVSSDDYDINFVDGTLVIDAAQNGGTGDQPAQDTTAPDVTSPRVVFVTGSTITGHGLIRLHTTWSASDDTGLSDTQLQRSIANKPFVQLTDITCPTGTSYDAEFYANAAARKQIVEQTRATDTSANTSDWVGQPFWVNDYQINSKSLHYGIKWQAIYGSGYWRGGIRSTVKPNATVALSAAGSAFAFVSAQGPDMGMVQVSVDGTPVATVDLYAPVAANRYVAWSTSFNEVGLHTVTVTTLGTKNDLSSGTRVVVDAFMAISNQSSRTVTPGLN